MKQRNKARFDAVSALCQGTRDHQEDAVVADFPVGMDLGVVVLSDGMGGHAAGDIASKIVMTEVYSELKFQSGAPAAFSDNLPNILQTATEAANECIKAHIDGNPTAYGMGATLVAAVLHETRLNWISVGDSLLLLFRDGKLIQLNEDHSMAPQIDFMVDSGMMDADVAEDHPDRNALTSVLSGDEIPKIDCPVEAAELQDRDIVIVASDGLQFLELNEIETVLYEHAEMPSAMIARALLDALDELDDPDQDNTSMVVIKVDLSAAQSAALPEVTSEAPDDVGKQVQPRRVSLHQMALQAGMRR